MGTARDWGSAFPILVKRFGVESLVLLQFGINSTIQWSVLRFQKRFVSSVQRLKRKLHLQGSCIHTTDKTCIYRQLLTSVYLLSGKQKVGWKEKSKGISSVSSRDWLQEHTDT